jgi:hypothetical protein
MSPCSKKSLVKQQRNQNMKMIQKVKPRRHSHRVQCAWRL